MSDTESLADHREGELADAAENRRQPTNVTTRFAKLLRLHGHGFHAAVLKAIHGTRSDYGIGEACHWGMLAAELPATLNGLEFHIDGVLEARMTFERGVRRFIALECKNKDKAYQDWCFIRSGLSSNDLVVDHYTYVPGTRLCGRALRGPSATSYDLAVELKSDAKQECPHGKGLQQALIQTFRSAAGLAHAITQMPRWTSGDSAGQFIVLPLLVTSANLYVSDSNLIDSEMLTGREPAGLQTRKVGWVWLTQNLNRSIRPSVERDWGTEDWWRNPFAQQMRHDATRSALIASVDSLDDALRQIALTDFDASR